MVKSAQIPSEVPGCGHHAGHCPAEPRWDLRRRSRRSRRRGLGGGVAVPRSVGADDGVLKEPWDERMNGDDMGMDQYLFIPFLEGWTSIYHLFQCSSGHLGFDF